MNETEIVNVGDMLILLRSLRDRVGALEARKETVPQGCGCPPTSEQTCQGPLCPRRNQFAGAQR